MPDNPFVERLGRVVKIEDLYLGVYETLILDSSVDRPVLMASR